MSPPEQTPQLPSQPADRSASPKGDEEVTTVEHPSAGVAPEAPAGGDMEAHGAAADAAATPKEAQAEVKPATDARDQGESAAPPTSAEAKGQTPTEAPPALEPADNTASSMATLKPSSTPPPADSSSQHLSADPANYVDPTPPTPMTSQPPSRTPSTARSNQSDDGSPGRADPEPDGKRNASDDEQEGRSRSEIQSIMEQFNEFGGGPGEDEVMSPRLEITSPMLGSPVQHPPRKSSLEPLTPNITNQIQEFQAMRVSTSSPASAKSKERASDDHGPPVPPKDGAFGTPPRQREEQSGDADAPSSPSTSKHRPPPPEPEPEPALPFDFHRFLEQLRNKKADPVARYLKSFLSEFGKKQWMVHEQVKIIGDFLAFIANKMMQCEVWREVSDAEFDNAREGMEKLVMNRLYTQTFSPAIPPPKPIPGAKPRRKGGDPPLGPGRRGQHQEDVERDDVLTQKINIYGWVREEHLDIPQVGDSGRRFLKLAQQELLKIKSYRAPRDKIICVLNCCKVIFGLLKHNKSDSSADSFMPLLIYVVLQCNPEHLVSNVQYILRFRNQEKLGGEAGYYLSSLMGVIQFVENMDRTSLTITDEEFEKNVEAAVSTIAERHLAESPQIQQQPTFSEKGSLDPGEAARRPSYDAPEGSTPRRSTSTDGDPNSESAAISGLLKTFQKPLSTIGRIFSDEPGQSSSPGPGPGQAPRSPRLTAEGTMPPPPQQQQLPSRQALSVEEAAARQASAEAAEAQRLQRAEHANVVETLAGMFPDLDKEVISDVVYQKEGRVGLAVDACLALST